MAAISACTGRILSAEALIAIAAARTAAAVSRKKCLNKIFIKLSQKVHRKNRLLPKG